MSKSKRDEPAHVDGWTLDVDDSMHPERVIVWRDEAEVARVPFGPCGLADHLAAAGLPRGTANEASNQVLAKVQGRWLAAGRTEAVV